MRESPRAKAKGRKAVSPGLDGDLAREAKVLGINLSRFAGEKLAVEVKRLRGDAWRAENRDAIEAYNRYVEKHEVFSNELRRF